MCTIYKLIKSEIKTIKEKAIHSSVRTIHITYFCNFSLFYQTF